MSFSVDGLVSGMDTTSMIQQLMQIEKQPQAALQNQRTGVQKKVTAYQDVNTKMKAVQDASAALATASKWSLTSATSSNTSVATATTAQGASPGTITFAIDRLASAGSVRSDNTVASLSAVVASGPVTVTKGGTTTTVDVGDGSLQSVMNGINRANLGVTANAVQVGANAYRLQVVSTTTGAESAVSVDLGGGSALGAMSTLTAAQDARITIGSGAGAYSIESASNNVQGVMPGVTINLLGTTPVGGPVTITVSPDADALADKTQKMVDAVNAALSKMRDLSSYDAEKKTGGVLLGDSVVRRLQQDLLQSVTGNALPGSPASAGVAGVSLTKDGQVTFDKAKFKAAYTKDPAGVTRSFTQQATSTDPSVTFVSAMDVTRPGSHSVEVTQAATRASVLGAGGTGTVTFDEVLTVKTGTKTATYTATGGSDFTTIAAGLNAAFAAEGVSLVAGVENGQLTVRATEYGSERSFTVESTGTETGLVSAGFTPVTAVDGVDVVATVNGNSITGKGQALSVPTTTDRAAGGMTMMITGAPSGPVALTYAPGLAQRAASLADAATDFERGSLKLAINGQNSRTKSLETAIASWDTRLADREAMLKRQFSALEVALGKMKQQSSWLAGQLASLSANN